MKEVNVKKKKYNDILVEFFIKKKSYIVRIYLFAWN